MLGVDGTVTGHRIAPARSACAVLVSSQNANRDWLYYQQQTISAEGFSGQAFSTFVPHTVRAKETKQLHRLPRLRRQRQQRLDGPAAAPGHELHELHGPLRLRGHRQRRFEAVAVAEHDEPEAIFGSDLQRIAYPDNYKKFVARHRELSKPSPNIAGNVLDIQARGEYAYAANGPGGFRVYDIANIDNKGFSERIVTAPVSPLGQRFYVPTKNAPPSLRPPRWRRSAAHAPPENEEQPIHLLYGFLYVADKEEGLVVVGNPDSKAKSPGVGTLLDGNPANNFLKRAAAFNPDGILTGAQRITIAGTYAYILTDKSLVVVDLDNPLAPRVTATIGAPILDAPAASPCNSATPSSSIARA